MKFDVATRPFRTVSRATNIHKIGADTRSHRAPPGFWLIITGTRVRFE